MNFISETWKIVTRTISPTEMAAKELAEAELRLLEAQSAVEYAKSIVDYNEQRIKRLRKFISSTNEVP